MLPLLLVLIGGLMAFGLRSFYGAVAEYTARQAVREAVLPPIPSTDEELRDRVAAKLDGLVPSLIGSPSSVRVCPPDCPPACVVAAAEPGVAGRLEQDAPRPGQALVPRARVLAVVPDTTLPTSPPAVPPTSPPPTVPPTSPPPTPPATPTPTPLPTVSGGLGGEIIIGSPSPTPTATPEPTPTGPPTPPAPPATCDYRRVSGAIVSVTVTYDLPAVSAALSLLPGLDPLARVTRTASGRRE